MFFKKKISEKERMEKQVKEAKAYFAFQSYHTVIRLAKTYTKNESTEDKILILNYFIDSILDDVCTSTSVAYLFNRQDGMLNPPFLSGFYDNSGAKLEIYTDKCDLCKMFPHCTTDGEKRYNSHTGEPFSVGVSDFRLAAVYTLAQMRYFIRKG